jgi:hypothetical protein
MIRKTLVLTVALFALIAASAQAHTIAIAPACGSVSISWLNFNDGNLNNQNNAGLNMPSYSVLFLADGSTTPVLVQSGHVTFDNSNTDRNVPQYTLVPPVTLPHANGYVQVTSTWTADQTSDGDAETHTFTDRVSGCINQPTLVTQATPTTATVGSPVHDVVTLSGGFQPTGSITWKLYGPADPTCSNPNAPSVTITNVNGDGPYPSPDLTPSEVGTYTWIAHYDGDINNNPFPGTCTDANETVTITPQSPRLSTSATPASATIGASITDVATLSGGLNPTGTISWNLYGPNDPTCTGSPLNASPITVAVTGDKAYTSPPLTPSAAGTYQWVASYTSDNANNTSISKVGCGDQSETVRLAPSAPAIVTAASPGVTLGGSVTDTASLTGATANATGTITWQLFGPDDATCSGTPLTTAPVPVNGNGNYTSPSLTPSAAGTYYWVATYSGDANNTAPPPTACAIPAETVTVSPPSTSSFTLVKTQSLTSTGGFTTAPITASVGQTIYYQITVKNTGNTPLSLALVDTMCTSIAGPTGDISGGLLAVGGTATYTCLHVVVAADFPTYVNVAQVTATPPGGPPLPPQRSSVLANIPQPVTPAGGVSPCTVSKTTLTQTVKTLSSKKTSTTKAVRAKAAATATSQTKTVTTTNRLITAILSDPNHGTDIKSVTFSLDGRPIKTLTKPNLSGGRFQVQVQTKDTRYGAHRITAAVTMLCGPAQTNNVSFMHALPAIKVVPHFTG